VEFVLEGLHLNKDKLAGGCSTGGRGLGAPDDLAGNGGDVYHSMQAETPA
jgi:hypothetical protein